MKSFFTFIVTCIICITALSTPVFSQSYAVTLRPSTLGISIEGIRSINRYVDARIGASYWALNYKGGEAEDDYFVDGDFRLGSISALVDWYPNRAAFHLTTGVMVNLNSMDALMTPSSSHVVSGRTYTPEMLGNLSAEVGFNRVAPYLGMGISFIHPGSGIGYMLDIGVMYHGQPQVDLSADGLLEPSAEQGSVIENNLSWFSIYPVISFGLLYMFN
ncbi:hypothetical protein ACFL47_08145 [Candidatus Latescibacterota bacterium]